MAYLAFFMVLALIEIASAMAVYVLRDLLHSVLALAAFFTVNSALLLMLAQPMIALLQLFIMVGGISTFIFVGVASSGYSRFRSENYNALGIAYIALFVLLAVSIALSQVYGSAHNVLSATLIAQSLSGNVALLYFAALLLFGAGFGSIVVMKRLEGARR